jgi:hypothetical protein
VSTEPLIEGKVTISEGNVRPMRYVRSANLIFAIAATLAPLAHVLELPNKFTLDGVLWLAVQQHLYRGWGPILGGPAEIGALVTTLALLVARRADKRARLLTLVAALAYAVMLAAYLVFNAPVNEAVNGWTPATLPGDWMSYRLQWETGHALAALMALIGLAVLALAFR